MSLNTIFSQQEIEAILHALYAQKKKCNAIAKKGITGYGTADELEKRQQWADKAEWYETLESKVAENSI